MRRSILAMIALTVAASCVGVSSVRAQLPPEYLDHYKLLPRYSILHQTGGIAGWDHVYRLLGEYDLHRSIGWPGTANFENAEIWGSILSPFPTPAVVLDVDQVLNLEGLKGEILPVAAPFDVYKFTGTTGDGSSVRLFASLIGPWMYVRGRTEPPAGSADFFQYDVRMLARSRPFADLNDDGEVNAADYVMLRKNIAGAAAGGPTLADWISQFGDRVPDLSPYDAVMSAALDSVEPAAVPEPAAVCMLLSGFIILAVRRSR